MQENKRVITKKKGRGGLPLFRVNKERVIPIYDKRVGGSNAVEVVGSFVKLLRQQNKKNYYPNLLDLDALAVASIYFFSWGRNTSSRCRL